MSLLHSFEDATGVKTEEEIMLKLLITALILLLTVSAVSPACGRAEYLIGQECCPMCSPGSSVRNHCNQHGTTVCVPCPPLTFTEAPNDFEACRLCRVCDSSTGLRVRRACTPSSDTLCKPLKGHYCTDPIKDGCGGAVEHTKCKPGQYIKQPGTASTDAVCEDCEGETYSNGSFSSCRLHTRCELMGLEVLKAGSSSHDTECGTKRNRVGVILGVIVLALAIGAGGIWVFILHRKKKVLQDKLSADGEARKSLCSQENGQNILIKNKMMGTPVPHVVRLTYTEAPNGLEACRPCRVCESTKHHTGTATEESTFCGEEQQDHKQNGVA